MGRDIALRRAHADDQKPVTTLVAKAGGASRYRKQYGAFNSTLLDSSYLSIVAYDPNDPDGALLGFVCFSDGPRDSTVAETWLKEANSLFESNWSTHNMLWIAFLVADPVPDVEQRTVEKMMRTAFATLPEIDYAVATLPFKEDMPSEMKKHFQRLSSNEKGVVLPGGAVGGAKGGETVMICDRENLVPSLRVRRAVVEDNDDLAPIFKEQEEALKENYGEFYVAELIKNQDESNVALVAEHDGRAVGLVAISRSSGAEHLPQHFNLQHFGNLVKKSSNGDDSEFSSKKDNQNEGPFFYSVIGSVDSQDPDSEASSEMKEICSEISQSTSLVCIDPLTLVDTKEELEDNELMCALIAKRLKAKDVVNNGAVLQNFPVNRKQMELLVKEKMFPSGFICTAQSFNDEMNDLYSYVSSGGRNGGADENINSSSTGKLEEEGKSSLESKSEEKEYDENKAGEGDNPTPPPQETFVPPTWTKTSENDDWLKLISEQVKVQFSDINVAALSESMSGMHVGGMKSNAFAITMFCLEGLFESRATDFLPHAFRAFPDLDYCILTVPTTVLLEPRIVRGFTAVLPLPGTSYSQSLYVIHRDSTLAASYLKVHRFYSRGLHSCTEERKQFIEKQLQQQELQRQSKAGAEAVDWDAVEESNKQVKEGFLLARAVDRLLKTSLPASKAIEVRALLDAAGNDDDVLTKDNPPRAAFVATMGSTGAVGIVIIDRSILNADRINFFKTNFDLEQYLVMDRFRTKAQAVVTAIVVDPVFHHQTRFMLKESMRLFEKNLLYFQSDPSAGSDSYSYHPPRLVYEHFCPAQPRKRPQLQPKDISSSNGSGGIQYEQQDYALPPKGFSLQFLSRAMLSEPRVSVQSRIVVIGATATTASFLQRFLLNSQLFYPNVTLISSSGFPAAQTPISQAVSSNMMGSTSKSSPTSSSSSSGRVNASASCQVVNEDMPEEAAMNALSLESRCRLLLAIVNSIDRDNKTVSLSRADKAFSIKNEGGYESNDVLPYDYLIITDELVDTTKFDLLDRNSNGMVNYERVWNPQVEDENALGLNNEIVSPVLSLTQPSVDLAINQAVEAANGGDIIVYGSTLQAAAAVGGLLAKGISPKRLSFIRPGWQTPKLDDGNDNTDRNNTNLQGRRSSKSSGAGDGGGNASSPMSRRRSSKKGGETKSDELENQSTLEARDRLEEMRAKMKAEEDGEDWDGPNLEWVRLEGRVLGDDRGENILTDTLRSLGVYDRNDIELLGVTGDKSTAISMRKYLKMNNLLERRYSHHDNGSIHSQNNDNLSKHSSSSSTTSSSSSTKHEVATSDARGTGDYESNASLEDERFLNGEGKENDEDDEMYFDDGIPDIMKTNLDMALFQKIGSTETLNLPCSVLLTCHNINIRPSLFRAINGCGLAYDGRLVVNPHSMQTTDPFIFAAGDLTKFSRKYAQQSHDHCYLSNMEIGQYLADTFSRFVDPSSVINSNPSDSLNSAMGSQHSIRQVSNDDASSHQSGVSIGVYSASASSSPFSIQMAPPTAWNCNGRSDVPIFTKPRTLSCRIPGGFHGRSVLASAMNPKMVVKEKDGQLIEEASGSAAWTSLNTGQATMRGAGNLSSVLRLDANNRLVDFSHVGPTPIESRNIGSLIGLHASYVKGCGTLHQQGGVSDWISFFRSEWAQPLYHDRFPQLINLLRNRLRSDDAAKDVLELMKRALEEGKDDQAVSRVLTNAIGADGERVTPGTTKRVEQVGFDWLSTNKSSFPLLKLPERSNK